MQVYVTIDEPGAEPERLEELSGPLRAELRDLDVDDVRPVPAGAAPPGSRGIDLAATAAFVVSLGGSAEAITQLVAALQAWVGRGRAHPRTVEMTVGDKTLRLTDATLDQQDRLVDEFVRLIREG
ncbi:effector-associated constant component EACC1 [Paractinoplanes rishiriensis]|uniref:Uncharacterized protein n=1 Tax=Paractinoplanes rishiriensis TaxID=1050105 RepID=A0A919MN81_9ACTN|nr:hypothetical protein [Actinoplanes rishiriensis]GIE93741.1 hypothetical protein Ari01nite_12060 [Actinoplanes rishiriensis]